MKKIMTIVGIIALTLVLLLAGGGVWAYYAFLHTEPLTQAELAELTPDWDVVTRGNWSPWYDAGDGTKAWNPAASYNAWVASVPEKEKAWPILIGAYYDHMDSVFRNDLYTEHAGTLPEHPERWATLMPVLATPEADALLGDILEAFSKPVIGAGWSHGLDPYEHAALVEAMKSDPEAFDPGSLEFDPKANLSMMDMMMGWLGRHRNLVQFVESKAAYELEQGNTEVFVSSIEGMLRSSDLCKEIPTMISMLVETAIENVAIRTIDWGITNHSERFDAESLQRLENALAHYANAEYLWQGEALQFHDTMRRLSNSGGKLNRTGVSSIQGGMGGLAMNPTSLPDAELHASSQRMMYVYNKLLALSAEQAAVPWNGLRGQVDVVFEEERVHLNTISALLIDIMLPAIDRAAARIRQHTQETIGVRLGIAVHRHRLRHGAFPESLDAIDDDLITFEPIDAFTGQQLGYTFSDDGPTVYSLGPDRVDNDGLQLWIEHTGWDESQWYTKAEIEWLTVEEAESLYGSGEYMLGDWVLFPMPVDDPEPLEADYDGDWDLKQGGTYEDVYGEGAEPKSDG